MFQTVFDDLDLYINLKHHYPSWGTSAYFPLDISARRPHHSKSCITIVIIIMTLIYPNTVLHVRVGAFCARLRVRVCACVRTRIYACMIIILYYYICGRSVCVRVCVCVHRAYLRACERIGVRVYGRMFVRDCMRVRVRMCAYVCA